MKKQLVKEVLSRNVNLLQVLHEGFGFDFAADFEVLKIEGRFTLNSLKKAAGVDFSEHNAAAIVTNKKYCEKWNYIVGVYNSGFGLDMPRRVHWFYRYDHFYCKRVFEETRKEDNIITYLFYQKKELEKKPAVFKADYNERFIYKSCVKCGDGRGRSGVDRLTLIDAASGETFDYKIQDRFFSCNTSDFIDKSGYITELHRNDLKRRAEVLRSNRKKAAADAADFTSDILEIEKTAAAKKAIISNIILKSCNYDDICNADKKISKMRWIYLDIDRLKKASANKTFTSVENAQKLILSIKNSLMEV